MKLPAANPTNQSKRYRELDHANHSRPPRTEARQSKIRSLTPEQRQALLHWLNKEKVIYTVARSRLLKKFGVSLSIWAISEFWHRNNPPQRPASPDSEVVIELVIHAAGPVRFVVKHGEDVIQPKQKS